MSENFQNEVPDLAPEEKEKILIDEFCQQLRSTRSLVTDELLKNKLKEIAGDLYHPDYDEEAPIDTDDIEFYQISMGSKDDTAFFAQAEKDKKIALDPFLGEDIVFFTKTKDGRKIALAPFFGNNFEALFIQELNEKDSRTFLTEFDSFIDDFYNKAG